MRVMVLNGPNLGRLGRREPELYGTTTHAKLGELCRSWGREIDLDVEVRQTNHEGQMLDWLGEAADHHWPVVLNGAAWTHYSYALADACAQLEAPMVEVHITDPSQRPEAFRHTSVISAHALAVVAGEGVEGYRTALQKIRAAVPEPEPISFDPDPVRVVDAEGLDGYEAAEGVDGAEGVEGVAPADVVDGQEPAEAAPVAADPLTDPSGHR